MTLVEQLRRVIEAFMPAPPPTGSLELGTVGWEDGKDHYDLVGGQPTLVKVTLWRGATPGSGKARTNGRAGGTQVLCRVSRPLNFIPEDGSEVMVALPAGYETTPGAGFIQNVTAPAPEIQHSETKAKMEFGPEVDLVIKARSVTISDYQDRYITVGPDYGIKGGAGQTASGTRQDLSGFCLKDGKWQFYVADADGYTVSALQLAQEATLICNVADDGKQVKIKLAGGDSTYMCAGKFMALYATGLLGNPAGLPAAVMAGGVPVPSTNTFIAGVAP